MANNVRVHLRQIAVANHCTVDWNTMRGDAATRFCGSCRSNVHNLSEMSETEVEGLLARSEDVCIRYYYRPDGTIVTSSCPTEARRAPTALAAGVASALVYSTAFIGISTAISGSADTTASAAQDDGNLKVAMGMKLTLKVGPPLTPEERRLRQIRREQRRHLAARTQDVSDAMPNLAPSVPGTATALRPATESSVLMPTLAWGGAAALIALLMILGTTWWPIAGLATVVAGVVGLARRHPRSPM